MRVSRHNVASLLSHTQEVCGLSWSPSGTHLASGGNDNFLNIWDVNLQSSGEINTPVHSLADHKAAVKVNFAACFMTQISLTLLWFVSLLLNYEHKQRWEKRICGHTPHWKVHLMYDVRYMEISRSALT